MKHQLKPFEDAYFDLSYFNTFSEDRCKALSLLVEMGLVMHKIRHCMVVADTALVIANNVEKELNRAIDKRVVEVGALLHDVGLCNLAFEAGKNDFLPEHYYIGAEIALQAGYSEEVARCIECHDCGGLVTEVIAALGLPVHGAKENTLPETWEEKIVAYADTVISVEGEAGCDVWNDDDACAKGLFNYLNVVYINRLGICVNKKHPQFQYINAFNKDMRRFLPKEQYEKQLRPQIQKMNQAQMKAGILLPFPSIKEW